MALKALLIILIQSQTLPLYTKSYGCSFFFGLTVLPPLAIKYNEPVVPIIRSSSVELAKRSITSSKAFFIVEILENPSTLIIV